VLFSFQGMVCELQEAIMKSTTSPCHTAMLSRVLRMLGWCISTKM
jgi:hypothetical protein